jgi:hypothetical protein
MTATATCRRWTAAVALAGAGAVAGSARAAAAEAARPSECFGGPATAVVTGEKGPAQPIVVGDALYWLAGGEVRWMPLAGKAATTMAREGAIEIKVLDAKLAVGSTGLNNLEAIDLPAGKSRVIVEGNTTMEEPLLFSSLALDDKYLYFGRGENQPPFTSSPRIGFHRVRRSGAAGPELLAHEPDGQTTFVVADGFVYWRNFYRVQGSEKRALELSRRRLQKDAPIQVLTPLRAGGRDPLVVNGGRVYYVDGDEIRSVPVAGGAQPVTHAMIGHQGVLDLLADGACVYWLNAGGAILRAQGERGAVERIGTVPADADEARWNPEARRALASDGTRLYWADAKTGSIMAVGRTAAVAAAEVRTIVARPAATQAPRPGGSDRLLLGSGWGCSRRSRRATKQMQCWQVPAAAGASAPAIRARPVPWLAADHYAATADRLCALTAKGARCWRPAELFGPAPADVSFAPMSEHTIYDPELAAGGGVTCTEKDNVWTCAGDDSFGQLGTGASGGTRNRLFGGHISMGAFHGCVSGDSVLCWGRNDTLQLGFPTTETCRVDGRDVPCSRGAKPPAFALPRAPGVYAGDTFTCARRGDVQCWGASRDGLFGTADACPPALRTAFPTRAGSVAAPNATCSATPAELRAFSTDGPRGTPIYAFAVGPRGVCGVVGALVRCAGAIPTPPQLVAEQFGAGVGATLVVSPGDDPSACAVTQGGVTCWGAGYSPGATPNRPVPITFAEVAADGPAVDVTPAAPGAKWAPGCGINEGCPPQPAPPPCPAGVAAGAVAWSALAERPGESAGKPVIVRGPLLVQASADAAPVPGQRCAPAESLPIVIGKNKNPLLVDGLACNGDESRRCCAAPAFGQDVIARGQLTASGSRWILRNPQLCSAR